MSAPHFPFPWSKTRSQRISMFSISPMLTSGIGFNINWISRWNCLDFSVFNLTRHSPLTLKSTWQNYLQKRQPFKLLRSQDHFFSVHCIETKHLKERSKIWFCEWLIFFFKSTSCILLPEHGVKDKVNAVSRSKRYQIFIRPTGILKVTLMELMDVKMVRKVK